MAKKLQMCGTEEEMREVAARICKNYLYGAWKTVNPKELNFKRISGGLSNFLYYVALPEKKKSNIVNFHESENALDFDTDGSRMFRSNSFTMDEPKKVLLRIYGQVHGDRAMDAIVTESVIFTLLSERRLGPKLYGVFSGGRIEEFIPARPLTTRELGEPALSMKIAEKMAAIHTMDIPLSKEPNWIWKTMSKWIKAIKEERKANTYEAKNDLEKNIIKELNEVDFDQEFEWLKKFIVAVSSPVVFCHNDMQEGNILSYDDSPTQPTSDDEGTSPVYVQTYSDLTRSQHRQHRSVKDIESFDDAVTSDSIISGMSDSGEPQLVFIDFEYCAYNYRGFDIANHFQEWRYDYTNPDYPFYHELLDNMPSLEQKEIFIKEYLKHSNSSQTEDRPLHTPTIDEINKLFAEVDAFALASHLFWSIWSVLNASKSQIPFGYWPYALSRYEVYRNLKQEVIKKESFGIAQKRKICEVDI